MARSARGLSHHTFTVVIMGSNPIRVIIKAHTANTKLQSIRYIEGLGSNPSQAMVLVWWCNGSISFVPCLF